MGRGIRINWSEYAGYDVGEDPMVLVIPQGDKEALRCLLDAIIQGLQECSYDEVELDPVWKCHFDLLNGWLRELRCWLTLDFRH